ncbi:hypothetical protein BDV25DRAFT_164492 [Aspergillus avenaceus]|uniref:Uncharacterized protein n=1 Tax=Aspergillus avenaceus TaxID=36643 RepID=A0A5N6TGS1_ASPAV|nr:hypothetical protein BDV25DRAFT_164492 [Aspergillus avenaceus]
MVVGQHSVAGLLPPTNCWAPSTHTHLTRSGSVGQTASYRVTIGNLPSRGFKKNKKVKNVK